MTRTARFCSVFGSLVAALSLACETQPTVGPARPALVFNKSLSAGGSTTCRRGGGTDRDAPDSLICAISVPGNPIISGVKGWVDPATEQYYLADQSNSGVDVIDAERYEFVGRVPGFVGALTGGSGGTITTGGGTATSNGQGPNSIVPTRDGEIFVSDGNATVQVVNTATLKIVKSISTAVAACDGGTATTHYCGRVNEMTYDPEDRIAIVENPSPLSTASGHTPLHSYATLISAVPPYKILGTITFENSLSPATTTEAPVWDRALHRFLLPVPTGNSASTGATQEIAVIDPRTATITKTYALPDCAHLMPDISPPPTGMLNDLSIDERDQHVLMEACGRGELIFDARNGNVVNVVTQIGSTDESWFNPGDGRFYVVAVAPGGASPGNALTTSLGIIDGRTGKWLQNVLDVGGKNPAADAETNHAFVINTVPVGVVAARDSTACAAFGFKGTGCITVAAHAADNDGDDHKGREGDRGDGHGDR